MGYRLDLSVWNSVFAVPSSIVDSHLKIAGGDHIKVLLLMLRYPDREFSLADISAAAGVTADTAEDALIFWEQRGVIANNGGVLTPVKETVQPVSFASADIDDKAVARAKLTSDIQFPPREIARTVNGDDAFRCLCATFERLAGRPTKHSERNTLMVITDEIGLPSEVALMLVEYCFSMDKATPAYMKSVALDWVECGIDNIAKAEERISVLSARNTLEGKLRTKFRMTSAFSKKQKEIIAEWAQMGISEELIDEAYEKTLNQAGKLSFPYMDSILRSWKEKGITSPEQIQQDKPVQSPSESSFDINALELSSYERYRKKE